jgi:hypothetical protein
VHAVAISNNSQSPRLGLIAACWLASHCLHSRSSLPAIEAIARASRARAVGAEVWRLQVQSLSSALVAVLRHCTKKDEEELNINVCLL